MPLTKIIGRSKTAAPQEEHWIPLSDLMTGLMMLFMLVAIIFMVKVEADAGDLKQLMQQTERMKQRAELQAQQMRQVAVVYNEIRAQLYEELKAEFSEDLPIWKAELDKDLVIRFEEPEVLFDTGQYLVKQQFKRILDSFFPRYLSILSRAPYRDVIEEIRIEGHTSSAWSKQTNIDEAYIKNMELSQSRTRSTLEYVLQLPQVGREKGWLTARLTANGLSSSRLRLNLDRSENARASQRVEFRVRTNSDARIGAILEAAQP